LKNVAIIGCGLIGGKRAAALGVHRLIATADTDLARAQRFSDNATTDWRQVVKREDVDLVIVATTNDALAEITQAAIEANKHVLVEKPAARNLAELRKVQQAAKKQKVVVKVGFNHRFHPAIQKAREIFDSGGVGDLMFVRARYGHGGRLDYEKEWRANPEVSGGGELLDQGVHLIDLSRWFAGEFTQVWGRTATFFWPMKVEDNGFCYLTTAKGQAAWLHASCSEWKNMFSMEIYGRTGKLQIDGLGGSYGVERLTYYKMSPQMGPPEAASWDFQGPDKSWECEFADWVESIDTGRRPCGDLDDAMAAMKIVESIYQQSAEQHS